MDYLYIVPNGYLKLWEGKIIRTNEPTIIHEHEREYMNKKLKKSRYKPEIIPTIDLSKIPTKIKMCQHNRGVKCDKCLHGHAELDDCAELKILEESEL